MDQPTVVRNDIPEVRVLGSWKLVNEDYPFSAIGSSIKEGYFLVDKLQKSLNRLYNYHPFRSATSPLSFPYRLLHVYLVNTKSSSFFFLSMSHTSLYLVFFSLTVKSLVKYTHK